MIAEALSGTISPSTRRAPFGNRYRPKCSLKAGRCSTLLNRLGRRLNALLTANPRYAENMDDRRSFLLVSATGLLAGAAPSRAADERAVKVIYKHELPPVSLQGRELTADAPQLSATPYSARDRDETIRAYRDAVRETIGSGGKALVDVRSPQEYSGDLIAPPGYEQEGAQRAGHIPTAASIPWAQAVRDDGTFKTADELRTLYEGKGVTADKAVTAYCRIGFF